MGAILQANAKLMAGDMAVLKRNYGTDYEGIFFYDITYVCLKEFLPLHIPKFRPKMVPPTALPIDFAVFNLSSIPVLWDVTVTTEHGLSYIEAKYSTNTTEEIVVTTSNEERSFSASLEGGEGEESSFISFDYMAETVTVTATNTHRRPARAYPGMFYNFRQGGPRSAEIRYYPSLIFSYSKTKSSRGQFSYTTTSTGIYSDQQVEYGSSTFS